MAATDCDRELASVRSQANEISGLELIACHRELIQAKVQLYVLKLIFVQQDTYIVYDDM